MAVLAVVPFSAGADEQDWEQIGTGDWGKCELNEGTKCGFRDGTQTRELTFAHYEWMCPDGYTEEKGKCKNGCEWFDWKCKPQYADKERVQTATNTEIESQACQVEDEDVKACEKEVIVKEEVVVEKEVVKEVEVIKEVPTFIDRIIEPLKSTKPKMSLSQGPNGVQGDGKFQVEWKKIKGCKDITIAYSKSKTFGKDGKKKNVDNDGSYTFTNRTADKYYVKVKGRNCGSGEWSKTDSIRP